MKKIVFIDVDGTMYHAHEESISDSIKQKLKEASKHVDLFVSTGRCNLALTCLKEARNYFKGFVLSNGAYVLYNNQIVSEKVVEKEDMIKLIQVAKELKSNIGLITDKVIYVDKLTDIVDYALTPRDHNSIQVVDNYNFDLNLKYHMAWSFDELDKINVMEEKLPNNFTFFKWGKIGSDIILNDTTKAKGIVELIKHLDGEFTTYAIGDSGNDIPMFKLVDVPICMGNGTDAAKEHAIHITKTLDEGGLELALDNIIKGVW